MNTNDISIEGIIIRRNNYSNTDLLAGYVIEKRPLIGKGARWTKVVTLDATTHQYCVENLKESEFLFRIFAENSVGLSTPTNSEPVTLKTHASEFNLRYKQLR